MEAIPEMPTGTFPPGSCLQQVQALVSTELDLKGSAKKMKGTNLRRRISGDFRLGHLYASTGRFTKA